jgi:hypothetical protein
MSDSSDPLTQFWDALFSRQPERIRQVFAPLDMATRKALIDHLQRMVTEPDWQPVQRDSAQAALDAVHDLL